MEPAIVYKCTVVVFRLYSAWMLLRIDLYVVIRISGKLTASIFRIEEDVTLQN